MSSEDGLDVAGKNKVPASHEPPPDFLAAFAFSALLDAQRNTGMYGQKKTKLILIQCACCRRWQVVRVDPDDLERHENGMYIQDACPYLPPDLRQLLISQTCGDCWSRLCADDPLAYS